MSITTVEALNSELGRLLRPYIIVGQIFGSNWLSNKQWLQIVLRTYCTVMSLLNIFIFCVLCTYFDKSEGINPSTMLKLYLLDFTAMAIVCHSTSIRLQYNIINILAKTMTINKGSIPSVNSFSRLVKFCSVAVVNMGLTCVTSFYLVLAGPLDFPFKPKTLGSYDITTAFCGIMFLVSGSLSTAFLYNLIFCTLLKNYCDWFHSQLSESQKLSPEFVKEWFENYKRFAELVELIDAVFAIFNLLANGLLFGMLIIQLLLVARGISTLSNVTAIFTFFGAASNILFIVANVVPVIIVNEKLDRTPKILWTLSETDDVYANQAVQMELRAVLRNLKYRGTIALTSAKFFSPTRYSFLTMASLAISYFIMFFRMDSSNAIYGTSNNYTNRTM